MSYHSYGQLTFGVKAGANINTITSSNSNVGETYKTNVGFHLGVFGQLGLKKKFFLIPELQYTQRGATFNGAPNSDIKLNLNYLELPILLSYRPIKQINIDFGPSASYKISSVTIDGSSRVNVDNIYNKKIDFGISMGARFNVSNKFSIIGRYYYGVVSIADIIYADVNNNRTKVTYYNRTIQLGLSYRILN